MYRRRYKERQRRGQAIELPTSPLQGARGPNGEEERTLLSLGDPAKTWQRGETLHREKEPTTGFYLLLNGWVASSISIMDERRLVQKMHLPGDMLGTPSMAQPVAADTLRTVTDATTAFVPYRAMLRFRRMASLQKFASLQANIHNHFNLERHLIDRQTYKLRRSAAPAEWQTLMS